jgi:hypothetical protein
MMKRREGLQAWNSSLSKRRKKSIAQDESKLEFGHQFTDYMFLMEYDKGVGCTMRASSPTILFAGSSTWFCITAGHFRRPQGLPCAGRFPRFFSGPKTISTA